MFSPGRKNSITLPGWMRWLGYSFFQVQIYVLVKIFFRVSVEGKENVPSGGGVIIAPNHSSYLDIFVLCSILFRQPWFLGKKELFFEPFKTMFKHLSWIPISRTSIDRAAISGVVRTLNMGGVVVIFPEGTRNNGEHFGKPKPGIGMILKRSRKPLVPVYIEGTSGVLPKGKIWPKLFSPIRIVFGKPVYTDDLVKGEPDVAGRTSGKKLYQRISEEIMERIGQLSEKPGSKTKKKI